MTGLNQCLETIYERHHDRNIRKEKAVASPKIGLGRAFFLSFNGRRRWLNSCR